MKTQINCLHCGKEHLVEQREINRGNGKFCSLKCSAQYNAKKKQVPNVYCAWCHKHFYRRPSRVRKSKSGLVFCGQQCHNDAARLGSGLSAVHPAHYNDSNNYRRIAFNMLSHKCNRCGYDKYPQILQVHHQDKNRDNNTIDNLEILCPNCHAIEHWT